MVMLAGAVADDPPESVTFTVRENPPAVGVLPEIVPPEDSDKPGGNEPPARDQE
jgi:hypothetical protein